ncbi:MAG TPA: sugar kinase [Dehalococcoidia bacterium]|nr:sugar kinase [Dehalococcoidia bacterium]
MYDVVTFGEAMIRLSPPHFQRLEQAQSLEVQVGGAELNVAVALSRLGLRVCWVSRLPQNPLGAMIRNKAREQGVDTSHILWAKEGRAGLYFVEFGASPRASRVLYDRAASAISQIQPGEVGWEEILRKTRLFHVSGITPALSTSAAQATGEALQVAKKVGCTVSYDLNYRARLWTEEKARQVQTPFMDKVDILFSTEEDTGRVFGIRGDDYRAVAHKLAEHFGFQVVCITLREDITVWRNRWTAIAYSEGKFYDDRSYEVEIVDRLGAGDSFAAGFIYGYLAGDIAQGVRYGNALAALKHSIPGDVNWATGEEMEAQIKGAGLRISR